MLRSKLSLLALTCTVISFIFVQGCGDDTDRKKGAVTDYSNYVDLRLTTLEVDVGELEPAFDPDYVGPYTLNLATDVESINITAATNAEDAVLEIYKQEFVLDENGLPIQKFTYDENGTPVWEVDENGEPLYDIRFRNGLPIDDGSGNYVVAYIGEINQIEPGEVDTKTIREGDNVIGLRVRTQPLNHLLTYTINVHRVNSKAMLLGLDVFDPVAVDLDPEFDPAVPNIPYVAEVAYETCMILLRGRTNDRYAGLTVNGLEADHLEFIPYDVEEGDNSFALVAEAAYGGATESYSLVVKRATGTEAEYAADATLNSMILTGVEFARDFGCYISSYEGAINRDVTSMQLTAVTSIAGASIRYGEPVVDGDGEITGLKDGAITVESGTPLDISIEENFIERAVEVTATNGTAIKYYVFNITRRSTNWVAVATAAELQSALKNAEPGDEIVLASGEYTGEVSVEASGDAQAHFFSDRSGTADDPIILRSRSSSVFAQVTGADHTANDALKLNGNHWQIKYLQIGGAQNGLVLDAASNNTIENLLIDGVGERALIVANGSSHNQVRGSSFANTGLAPREGLETRGEAIVIGSSADDWATAPDGTMDEKAYDNTIRSNTFGPNIAAEAIEISEGTLRTLVQYNIFDTQSTGSNAEDSSLLVIKGNDASVSYNSFINSEGSAFSSLLSAKNVSRDWVTDNWGENNNFFQNISDLAEADIALANSNDVSVLNVAENSREDDVEVRYDGAGINTEYQVPVYQLQTSTDAPLCLREERPYLTREQIDALGENRPFLPLVYMADCAQSSDQYWKLVNGGDGYIMLAPADDVARVLVPATPRFVLNPAEPLVTLNPAEDFPRILNFMDGYMLRWLPVHNGDEVVFANRGDWAFRYVLTGNDEIDTTAMIALSFGSGLQQFKLIEQ